MREEKGDSHAQFFWRSLGEKAAKKGFLLEIMRGYNSWGPCTRFGLGVQRGTFGAGWSARPRQLAGWQNWFGLVEFQSLGRTFWLQGKARRNGKQGHQQRWSYQLSTGIFPQLYGNSVYLNIKGLYVVKTVNCQNRSNNILIIKTVYVYIYIVKFLTVNKS